MVMLAANVALIAERNTRKIPKNNGTDFLRVSSS
jgi:hypothetical protein